MTKGNKEFVNRYNEGLLEKTVENKKKIRNGIGIRSNKVADRESIH